MRFFKRKDRKPLEQLAKQADTLILSIAEHIKMQRGDWVVKVLFVNASKLTTSVIMASTVAVFATICENVEDYLREEYGAADYRICIYQPNGQLSSSYSCSVGGPKAYKSANAMTAAERTPPPPTTDTKLQDMVAMMTAMKALMPEQIAPDTGMKDIVLKIVEGQLQGGSSKMEELAEQMLITRFNNDINKDESEIDRLKGIIEIGRMFTPSVPPEDPMNSIIQIAPALLAAFASMKSGGTPATMGVSAAPGAPALTAGNGGLDLNALRNLAGSIPENMIGQLPADQQHAIRQLLNTGAPAHQGVELARPGTPESIPASGGIEASSPNAAMPPPAAGNPFHIAIDAMTEEIRVGLRGTDTDNQIAQKMLAMITAARGFTSGKPHPLLKGIMEATEQTGPAEFRRFCQAIPELGRDHERIERIGVEILRVMQEGATSTLDALEDDEDYETEVNFAENAENEDGNVSEPAGIPGETAKTGEQPGPVANPEADRAADEEDEDLAQAV